MYQQSPQQQTSLYATAPSPDAMPPYASSSYVSVPPYYAESGSSNQTLLPSYSAPAYGMPPLHQSSSLSESMASLNISSQIPYSTPPPQGSYVPPVSSSPYDQTYQNPPHHHSAATSSQPLNYGPSSSGSAYTVAPQPSYDQLSSSLMPSYATNQQVFDHNPRVFDNNNNNQQMGFDLSNSHYGEKQQPVAFDQSVARYGEKQQSYDSSQSYGASFQGYDFNNYGVPQGQMSVYDQGPVYSGPPQGRDFDRPSYTQPLRYEPSYQEKPSLSDRHYKGGYVDDDDLGLGDIYAYSGGNSEPYGARGTGSNQWGNRDSFKSSLSGSYSSSYGEPKLPRAVPKVDDEDRNGGVQKYRVNLLSDYGSGNVSQDVLCQIGLDGVRMISPSTNKTVRIYPLENITRWEINEPSIFTFWAKSAVDIEPRRIRLKSGSYTTNAILDTLTAACVQFSEMVDKDGPSVSSKTSNDTESISDQGSEKKRPAFVSWLTLKNKQTAPEEKDHWVPDEATTKCSACASEFGAFLRRHHCRNCGDIFCDKCTNGRTPLTADEDAPVVRVCDRCLAEVTQRLSNAKDLSSRPPPATRTHEDLARKLQEELEKNSRRPGVFSSNNNNSNSSRSGSFRGSSQSWSSSDGPGKRMREVACPTCTVHLQVQVPSSGTITVECGVCQHPFLVSAH